MARSVVPEIVAEKLSNRLSNYLLIASQGNEVGTDRVKTVVWTLRTVGFTDELVTEIVETAAAIVDVDNDFTQQFLTGPVVSRGKRTRKAALNPAESDVST